MNNTQSDQSTSIESLLAALYGRINYEQQTRVTPDQFKLRNMQDILIRMGNPHLDFPVIHVAGTKGKGSVSTMLGQILSSSGRRTGVYTSPHLESIHQRIVIDGCQISDAHLGEILKELEPVIAEMDTESRIHDTRPLTFFEITTAAAFLHFAKQRCDAVVLEVGLGGRLDSTNVCQPIACIITNISVDHTRQLGATVDKIAFEKAGIIKPDVPVISGTLDPIAADVIERTAARNESPLSVLDRDFQIEPHPTDSQSFSCSGQIKTTSDRFEVANLELQLIGQHQQTNAALAVATTQILNSQGWNISEEQIRSGLAKATLSGRAEVVSQNPTIVIDMAHNVASVVALVAAIQNDIPGWKSFSKRTLIFATSHDKDAAGMLRPLIECFDEIILTMYQNNPRGKSEQELFDIAVSIESEMASDSMVPSKLSTEPTPKSAWDRVATARDKDQLICITGSAFLVAELRKTIMASTSLAESIS